MANARIFVFQLDQQCYRTWNWRYLEVTGDKFTAKWLKPKRIESSLKI